MSDFLTDDPSQVYKPPQRLLEIQFDWFQWRSQHPEIFLARTGEDGEPGAWKALIAERGVATINQALSSIKKVARKDAKIYLADVLSSLAGLEGDSSHNSSDARPGQHWLTDKACWLNYCKDLIYAATWGPMVYVGEVERRRELDAKGRTASLRAGEALHAYIHANFQGPNIIKAQQATGDVPGDPMAQKRLLATIISCQGSLPPRPQKAGP